MARFLSRAVHTSQHRTVGEWSRPRRRSRLVGRPAVLVVVAAALALTGAPRASAATSYTYVVNSTADTNDTTLTDHACDGTCTLRSAIEQANFNCNQGPVADPTISSTIRFAIAGAGVHTIRPHLVNTGGPLNHPAALPVISCPVVIDGTSQGGPSYTGPPLIELDGEDATAQLAPGLAFGGNVNGSTVRGLIVNRWNGAGLQFTGRGGVTVNATFVVRGNFVGVDASGTRALPNRTDGITVTGPALASIGGSSAADRNVVSGNAGRGIAFGPSAATGSSVQGNYIGTDVTGSQAVPNTGDGVFFNGNTGAVIGGTAPGQGNLISGNGGDGFGAFGSTAGSYRLFGNRIGTTADGLGRLGNTGAGVALNNSAGHDVLGDTGPGAANTIAFNGQAGVTTAVGTGHRVSANSIFDNGGLGIDLTSCLNGTCPGPNANDAGDADGGANLFQNYPVVTSVASTSSATTIKGTLNSTANAPFAVEAFSSPACDESGFGEGKKFLGTANVTTTGNNAAFTITVSPRVPANSSVTATATDGAGNTSEFSSCRVAPK